MQRSIMSRLEQLEAKQPTVDQINTIVFSLVSPGDSGPVHHEPIAVRTRDRRWGLQREDGEDVEAFLERAKKVCPRNEWGMACLVEEHE